MSGWNVELESALYAIRRGHYTSCEIESTRSEWAGRSEPPDCTCGLDEGFAAIRKMLDEALARNVALEAVLREGATEWGGLAAGLRERGDPSLFAAADFADALAAKIVEVLGAKDVS